MVFRFSVHAQMFFDSCYLFLPSPVSTFIGHTYTGSACFMDGQGKQGTAKRFYCEKSRLDTLVMETNETKVLFIYFLVIRDEYYDFSPDTCLLPRTRLNKSIAMKGDSLHHHYAREE